MTTYDFIMIAWGVLFTGLICTVVVFGLPKKSNKMKTMKQTTSHAETAIH